MGKKTLIVSLALVLLAVAGCQTAAQHAKDVQDAQSGDQLTVGKVQREIRVGMSSADVVQILGSPNIVSSDDQRQEVWVYDRIATDRVYSTSSGGVSSLVLGAGMIGTALTGGGLGGSSSSNAGASSTSQRTLTVVIKFDKQQKVRDFSYHTSRF